MVPNKSPMPAAAIIVGTSEKNHLTNTVIAPGGALDMFAYRAKLTEIYTTIQLIKCLCAFYGIKEGAITFGCDGESALNQAFSSNLPFIGDPGFDLSCNPCDT